MRALALALLPLAACTPTPASIEAPAHTVTSPAPFQVPAVVKDAGGETIEDAALTAIAVGDDAVLDLGNGSMLRCLKYGVSTVTLAVGELQQTATVSCALIKAVQVSLPATQVILVRDADGKPRPEALGTLATAVIGLDDQPIAGLSPQVANGDDSVLKLEAGAVTAVKPGVGRIKALHGTHEGEHVVLVGEEVVRRAGIEVGSGEGVGLPLEAGRYTINVGADQPVSVEAQGAECASAEGTRHELRCTFAATGSLRLEAKSKLLGGDDAKAMVRAVKWPMEGPDPSM